MERAMMRVRKPASLHHSMPPSPNSALDPRSIPPHTSHRMNRRQFLRHSAAAGTAVLGFPAILRSAAPNSTLQVASIGVGGMGAATMKSVATHPKVKIVALCDVDAQFLS